MKSILTIILALFYLIFFGQFRNTKWGMTTAQVEFVEKLDKPKKKVLDPSKRSNLFMSQTITVDNAILEITYLFENGKLIGGMYDFTPLNADQEGSYAKLWETTKKI